MQAHGQEEILMGHNQVGWSSNPGKCVVVWPTFGDCASCGTQPITSLG